MGNFLNQPVVDKSAELFEFSGKTGAVVSMQGWRVQMEDAHVAEPVLSWLPGCSFFGVFDGHGGSATSEYCKQNILSCIERELKATGITNPTDEDLVELLKKSFITFDDEIRNASIARSGSTAICGFITPTSYIISNLGDSRCVLCRDGKASPLSVDHKPSLELEKKRIFNAGGFVANNRVNGDLAVSRSFGDFDYKTNRDLPSIAQQVSCEPDVRMIPRNDNDNYLIFACDGIWDVFPDPANLIPVLDEYLVRTSYKTTEEAIARMLDKCLELGSKDNMTMMVVPLNQMPLPDESKIAERLEMEQAMKQQEEEKRKNEQESGNDNMSY